ncbi:diaminopropionate ammonia-lyase like protein [Zymoseptoria brevis]|uniref:Diaminopropionate ammonia-lyase like protein n=1 Tax=Zymoseptoria brevis TaxID=1047168 RepID=A0A0F4GHC0_9PEZI|nr:diaminopropionate ammonia-lyase like protein [Zymoseptoria brevis]
MSTYTVQHLDSRTSYARPFILHNPHCTSQPPSTSSPDPAVEAFHRTLPNYNETCLHNLSSIAGELGLKYVFLKDESTRFGLPAFKILGASWAIHRAICQELSLPDDASLEDVKRALKRTEKDVRLVLCSEGNWGRACARMGKILSVPATIYVPGFMSEYTQNLLRGEGADVKRLKGGSYDDSIAAALEDSERSGALLVMDTGWESYEQIPKWVTEGYTTMLTETDRQVAAITSHRPKTFFVSVGVGSWAHSVVAHYTCASPSNRVVTVEPIAAPSFKESLHVGHPTPIVTGETIMAGMNCGTTSSLAWPVLRDGVSDAVIVEEMEAHDAVEKLKGLSVSAGPCGAATLAALRTFVKGMNAQERAEMSVVLFSTEGAREYAVPK